MEVDKKKTKDFYFLYSSWFYMNTGIIQNIMCTYSFLTQEITPKLQRSL